MVAGGGGVEIWAQNIVRTMFTHGGNEWILTERERAGERGRGSGRGGEGDTINGRIHMHIILFTNSINFDKLDLNVLICSFVRQRTLVT